ncbi:MAG: hypothetical protein H0V54_05020 [Chthoniobacterales bacterium]|nr:hypothetical protein [Chthoniobacterales bacterium]
MNSFTKFRHVAAFALIALGGLCAAAALATAYGARGSLSFEERVAYQRKVEEVYWRHRVATQKEQSAQIPFAEAMPENAIRAKVEDSLRKSAALARYWQRPVTAAQLQAEVARIASQTKQPEVLRELFSALDNNPAIIAECLARPLLVERQLGNWYARDSRFHGDLRKQIEADLTAHQGAELKTLSGEYAEREFTRQAKGDVERKSQTNEGVHRMPVADSDWQALLSDYMLAFNDGTVMVPSSPFHGSAAKEAESPLPLSSVSMVREDDNQFYVLSVLSQSDDDLKVASVTWRKEPVDIWWNKVRADIPMAEPDFQVADFSLPQIAAPAADESWRPTSSALTPRENHTAVWTGTEMIVWGGFYNPSNYDNYAVTVGSRYNPATDSWSLTSTANAPTWRERHTAVWTGSEMIVWGGYSGVGGTTNTGARYNPATNTWTATSLTNAPTKRSRHTAVWTGSRMLVFAGRTGDTDSTTVNTGGSYDPVSNTWTALSTSNAPAPREYHTAIWTGTEMIVWGGYDGTKSTGVTTGGRYNPETNSWTATSTTGAPAARYGHKSVWTGTRMIVWGGQGPNFFTYDYLNTGAVYDPVANTWTATSLTGAPSPRSAHTAVWSGTEMIVWGGDSLTTRLLNGGRYNPDTNSWRSLSTVGAPQCSVLMSTVWTGSEMIVWGGQDSTAADINTGGRYNPQTDSWLPVTNPQNGGVRQEHPAVWTGAEMIVWGSYSPSTSPSNTGARYYPATDSWLPTSMVNVPLYRYAPQAVWTGSQMVVWGGCSDSFCFNRLDTGGRYNPASNSWQATSTVGVAEKRYWFSAVWTGTEMIVWGGCDAQVCGPGGNSDPNGLNNGGRYNPQTDTWQSVSTTGAPTGRWFHAADWSGSEMIVWGGINGSGPYNTGGKYNPSTNSWTATSTTGAPAARGQVRSVWTGSKLMVWGGYNSLLDQYFNTGGLYDPVANTWTLTSTTGAPSGRNGHTMVWTGTEAIVWGGCNGANCLTGQNTGGRYNPTTSTWVATTLVEAPQARDTHSAVWTGTEMIVFGGEPCARCEPIMDTGGRYSLGGSPPPPGDTVTITRAQYVTSKSQLTVSATSTDSTATLTVSVTSSGQVIGALTNSGGGNYTGRFRVTPNPVNITVTSSAGGSASKAVTTR